jgi:hypothetical protein
VRLTNPNAGRKQASQTSDCPLRRPHAMKLPPDLPFDHPDPVLVDPVLALPVRRLPLLPEGNC